MDTTVKYQEYLPHTVLQDNVKRFWVLEKAYTLEDSYEEVTPDACIELILNFGNSYVLVSDSRQRQMPPAFLVGLQNHPLMFQCKGVVKIVAVRFFAWGTLPFLGTNAQLGGTLNVALHDEWRALFEKVKGQVQTTQYQEAVETVEDFLIGKRLTTLFDPQQVQAAAKLLYSTKGQFRVAELADYCNLSVRQLQRQFNNLTGVSPKTLARTIRFEEIRNRLMFDPNADLTRIAHEFDFTDQAHFINDFKAFTHKTPGEFVAEMRSLQEVFRDHENVVFLQSPPTMLDYTVNEQ